MPEGGKLTIETGNADLDERYTAVHEEVVVRQYVLLSLTDTGSGMPQEVIERTTGLRLRQPFGFVKQPRGTVLRQTCSTRRPSKRWTILSCPLVVETKLSGVPCG